MSLIGGFIYTVAAVGSVADESFGPLIIQQQDVPVTAASARVFVLDGAGDPEQTVIYDSGALALADGDDVIAVGSVMDMTIEPLILTDDRRRVATQAKVRIVLDDFLP